MIDNHTVVMCNSLPPVTIQNIICDTLLDIFSQNNLFDGSNPSFDTFIGFLTPAKILPRRVYEDILKWVYG